MNMYSVHQVFTPTSPAILTFVERNIINNRLVDAIRTPGKQIVVYGHSGSGKTTLLLNKLNQLYENHITTRCMTGMSFESLMLDAFDQLNNYYTSENNSSTVRKINSTISADYSGIKSSIGQERSTTDGAKELRVLPVQLTVQRLAQFVGEANCCWVLEDFHKIDLSEKNKLSQMMKIFMDMAHEYTTTKIIAIGAVGTAREVVEYDPEMRNRVSEIHVPLMSTSEIEEIISKGKDFLNIEFGMGVQQQIIKHCNGLAAVCHQLCLNLCLEEGIESTLSNRQIITSNSLERAFKRYIEEESDSIKSALDKALRQKKKRKYDNCRLILVAVAMSDEDSLMASDIFQAIKKSEPQYPYANITRYLDELQKEERGSILRFDTMSGKYFFSNPFHKVFMRLLSSKTEQATDLSKALSEIISAWKNTKHFFINEKYTFSVREE